MRLSILLVVLPFALALHATAQSPAEHVSARPAAAVPTNALKNPDVVKLSKIGIGDEAVIAKIRQAPTVDFALETDDLAALQAAGVSGKVIAAMLNRVSGAAVARISHEAKKKPPHRAIKLIV